MTRGDFSGVNAALTAAVGDVFPGAVACVWHGGECVFHQAVGQLSVDHDTSPTDVQTIYDLASLTKPLAVGTLLMRAVSDGQMQLDATQCKPLSTSALSGIDDGHWDRITIGQLASHCSGLPAWVDFGASMRSLAPELSPGSQGAKQWIQQAVQTTPLCASPASQICYSDLGYMALGWLLERRLDSSLDSLFDWVRDEFGVQSIRFRPLGTPDDPHIAPTERCDVRGRTVCGEVHDANAWHLGGVAGHAGLFGTAMDVARWANGLLAIASGTPGPLSQKVVQRFWDVNASPSVVPGTWRLCFDGVSEVGSSTGSHFGPSAVGHLGYTGTSVWVEVQRQLVVVLLSNRVHPTDHKDPNIKRFRPRFHDAVHRALFD